MNILQRHFLDISVKVGVAEGWHGGGEGRQNCGRGM